MMGQLLLIEDNTTLVHNIRECLDHDGHTVISATDRQEGLSLARDGQFDVVIIDLGMPNTDGNDLMASIKEIDPAIEVIVLTRDETLDMAREMVRAGAYDFLMIPEEVALPHRLQATVRHVLEKRHLALTCRERIHSHEEREQLEQQVRESQKMKAAGHLAGSIAHDFNNLLATIIGNTHLIIQQLDPMESLHNNATQILEAGHRATELTQQLLAFNRSQTLRLERMEVNQVVSHLAPMLQQVLHKNITFTIDLGASNEQVLMDRTHLEQVIMNLVVNARDAMPAGGVLSVKTTSVTLDADETYLPTLPAGSYIQLDVQDTGCGMDETVLSHIFEPFFTTKKEKQGSGLGLATVYGIVKQSGGTIEVSSQPSIGATFTVYLPIILTGTPRSR